MKVCLHIITGIIFLALFACETDPVIYLEQRPVPVIFGVFNNNDTLHYIKVGKTFGAGTDPRTSAQKYDSLYFEEMESKIQVFVDRTHYKL